MAIIALMFALLVIVSFLKIRHSGHNIEFIYHWGFPIGAFVWEDLFVFSILGMIITAIVYTTRDNRVGYLSFSIFWIVRSAGETLYFFLEQFTKEKMYPHVITHHFDTLKSIFGNISDQKCFIIMQIFFQTVLVSSIVSTIYILMNWATLG